MLIVKHLSAKGFSLIEANYLRRCGEIDLVMKNRGIIHFIEVKTVSRETIIGNTGDFHVIHETNKYKPEQNVSPTKLRKISLTVQWYLDERGIKDTNWQFDVALVYLDRVNNKAGIRFLRDIPLDC